MLKLPFATKPENVRIVYKDGGFYFLSKAGQGQYIFFGCYPVSCVKSISVPPFYNGFLKPITAYNKLHRKMILRDAAIQDIPQIQTVRNAVKENMLSNPALVTDEDCKNFITIRGKGWVYEADGKIVGFAIADLQDNNIWALFLLPEYEGRGIGSQLHHAMLQWYF
jgi:hypothetical protein